MSEIIGRFFEYTHSNWIICFSNIILYMMWFAVMNGTHRMRFGTAATLTAELLFNLLFINIAVRLLPFMSVVRAMFMNVVFFIFCLVIYRDSKLKITLTFFLLGILNVLNEILGAATYFPELAMAGTPELLSTAELIFQFHGPYLLLSGLSFLLLYFFLNHVKFDLNQLDCAMLVLFPLSQYLLMLGYIRLIVKDRSIVNSLAFSATMAVCVLADVALIWVIRGAVRRVRLESENRQFEQLMEEQGKHYETLIAQYENIRRMRHDIAKHMDTVESLIHNGEQEQAKAYVAEMKAEIPDNAMPLCRHPVADAFLKSRMEAAAAQKIETRFKGDIRPDIAVKSTDLIRCLGNMLDNAYEVCANSEGRSVSLVCAETEGYLVIITENPAETTKIKREQRIPGLERGVGKRVLTHIAEKYEGSFSTEETEGMYRARLVLKAGKEEI